MPSRNFKISTNKLNTIDISEQSWCRMHLAFLIDLAFQIMRLRAAEDMKSCDASSEAKICYMAWRHDMANDDMAGYPLSLRSLFSASECSNFLSSQLHSFIQCLVQLLDLHDVTSKRDYTRCCSIMLQSLREKHGNYNLRATGF